jgi:hypothetical protein
MMNKKTIIATLLSFCATIAMAQRIGVSGDMVDCGQVMFRNPVTAEFEISNKSSKPLFITKVRTDCGCTVVDYPKEAITKGQKYTIHVTYDSKLLGHFYKYIGIYSNGDDEPTIIKMKGIVVNEYRNYTGEYKYKFGDLEADANDIEFDNVNRGENPQVTINIKNASSVTIQPQVMHLPNYLSAEVSPSKLDPGQQGKITYKLNSNLLSDFGLTQTSTYLGANPGEKISHDKEVSISAVLLPSFSKLTASQLLNAPKMKISTTELNLGKFNGREKLKGTVEIENIGKSRLDISSLQMFTSGLQISLNKTKIAPGEKAKLKVTADESGMKAARSEPRILMITNDPDNAKIVIRIVTE